MTAHPAWYTHSEDTLRKICVHGLLRFEIASFIDKPKFKVSTKNDKLHIFEHPEALTKIECNKAAESR